MDKIYIPLSCGVGLYEKDNLCVAIVDCQGCKKVGGRFINPKSSLFDKPFLRGLGFFFNYLVLLIMSLEIASGLEKRSDKEKKALLSSWVFLVVGCILLAFLLGLCGFGILPKYLIERVYMGNDWLFKNFLVSLTRVALIVIVLFLFKFLPSFSLLYAFNFQAHADKSGNMREVSPLNFLNLTLNSFIFSTFVITLFGVKINVFADFLINLIFYL